MALDSTNPQLTTRLINQIQRTVSAPAELLGAVLETELQLPNGSYQSAKLPTGILFQALAQQLAGPNNRKDLRKHVRLFNGSTPGGEPNDSRLDTLDPNFLCLFTTATVEFGPDGYGQEYRLLFDPNGALQVFLDGRFTGPKISARWVLIGSEEEATMGVDTFNELADRYARGKQVIRVLPGSNYARLFELQPQDQTKSEILRSQFPNNLMPAPTGQPGDIYWVERQLAMPGYIGFEALGVELARALITPADPSQDEAPARVTPPRMYRILRYTTPANPLSQPPRAEFDVAVWGVTPTSYTTRAVLIDNGTDKVLREVNYDLTTDTFTEIEAGGSSTGAAVQTYKTTLTVSGAQSIPMPAGTTDVRNLLRIVAGADNQEAERDVDFTFSGGNLNLLAAGNWLAGDTIQADRYTSGVSSGGGTTPAGPTYWEPLPRSATDATGIAAHVTSRLASYVLSTDARLSNVTATDRAAPQSALAGLRLFIQNAANGELSFVPYTPERTQVVAALWTTNLARLLVQERLTGSQTKTLYDGDPRTQPLTTPFLLDATKSYNIIGENASFAAGQRSGVVFVPGALAAADKNIDFQAEHNGTTGFSDLKLSSPTTLLAVTDAYNATVWRWQLLSATGAALAPVRSVVADCAADLSAAWAATPTPAFVVVRHEVVRTQPDDVASFTFTYQLL